MKPGFVYIMTNKNKTTLYTGGTNDLCRRVYEHKNHMITNTFTDKYNLEYCIYYEEFSFIDQAIHREKEIKKWNRKKKEDLINEVNPEWKEMVSGSGFLHEKLSFSQQVNDLITELQQSGEIPLFPGKETPGLAENDVDNNNNKEAHCAEND
jgi:putative endonuclease